MSQFTPVFHGSGAGSTEGSVPDPGNIAGTSRYLREDATWAVPNAGPPGPPAPSPGPGLDQWACNAAGYILYDICYRLVKSAVDTNLISLGLDAVVAFAFDGLASILLPLEILDAGFLTFLENWVSTQVQANLAVFEAHLLDQVLWSKFHCFLYNDFRAAGGVSQAILLAAGTSLAASGIAPSQVTNGIALLLQQFGAMTVGPVPLSAFVQNYDCSGCAGTGTDTAPIPLQAKFDLIVKDSLNRGTFIDEIDVTGGGVVTVAGNVATLGIPDTFDASAIVTGILPPVHGGTGVDSSGVANGQLLIGNGTTHEFNVASLTPGAGMIITPSAGGLTLAVGGGGGGAGLLIALVAYGPDTEFLSNGTASVLTAIDTTHLRLPIPAGFAGGDILIKLSCLGTNVDQDNVYWGLLEGSTTVAEALLNDIGGAFRFTATYVLTGVSAGAHNYDWAYRSSPGRLDMFGSPVAGGSNRWGQAVMEAWGL